MRNTLPILFGGIIVVMAAALIFMHFRLERKMAARRRERNKWLTDYKSRYGGGDSGPTVGSLGVTDRESRSDGERRTLWETLTGGGDGDSDSGGDSGGGDGGGGGD